jgi:GDP/UDP-N,N'-diacetylbacillosamine 2-epimerase (hydrolysing)
MKKKKILIVTERRADFSRFKPVLEKIKKDKDLDYILIVTGVHLLKKYGYSINEIKKTGFKITNKFKMYSNVSIKDDDGASMVSAFGVAVTKLSKILKKNKPDIVLSGFDIAANFAVTVAAAHMNIPVAHIQGGEVSGTIDESIRHAMSKFSHYHLVSNTDAFQRLIKMGEEKSNVFIVGCPSIEALFSEEIINEKLLSKKFGIDFNKKFLLVIQHSVTSEINETKKQINNTIKAIKKSNIQTLFICPNNDAGSKTILNEIKKSKNIFYTPTLTLAEYRSLLEKCFALVGNSSSGIHEASSFLKPVINIGSRQNGRLRSKNIIDVNHNPSKIFKALKKLENKKFYVKLTNNLKNPYYTANTSLKILKLLKKINIKKKILQKRITY